MEAFVHALPFTPTAYQRRALTVLSEADASLIVVAPTGAGKSVVADAAIWQAMQAPSGAGGPGAAGGGSLRAVYTSPLRALANQRFGQLETVWGERVGLVTGDTVVRPRAPLRVMTAEVYRLMALTPREPTRMAAPGPPAVSGDRPGEPWPPAVVVFDEAHYVSDPERGTVWEEALLATARETRIVCLSATVGQPERMANWLRWLGREVELIEERERPVPLRHYLSHKGDLHLVMDADGKRAQSFPFAGGWALAQRRPAHLRGGPMAKRGRVPPPVNRPDVSPNEWVRREAIEALRLLRERDLTPTIAYVSGRREAELLADAARAAFGEVGRGESAAASNAALGGAAGIAFHHAGLPPAERRRVERALARGEAWLVCATTTLAAGLDVPARSVLVTSFGRFDGRLFTLFTPAEYAQLAGRAGRLGKDEAGAVVLLANPWHGFDEAFRKLTAPLPPVESAFRVSYPTALAWWGAGGEDALARALATTFDAYLRKSKGGRVALPPLEGADGPSVLQARAIGRLLVMDGLADEQGALAERGRFVLRVGGGSEGRLLLRVLEESAVAPQQRAELLAALSEGPLDGSAVLPAVRSAHAAQVEVERRCGALLTAPLQLVRSSDAWRRRAAAADLLERAQRAARATGVSTGLLEWSGLEGDES